MTLYGIRRIYDGINTTYEVYNAITGKKVEIDINDPTLSEVKDHIEFRQNQREQQRQLADLSLSGNASVGA